MRSNFFLYGVYDEDQKCFSRFKNLIVESQPAYVKGTLCLLNCGLPVLKEEGDNLVSGTLVELNVSDTSWAVLDTLNGYQASAPKKSFMVRKNIDVYISEGAPLEAQTYVLNPEKKNMVAEEITCSDWQQQSSTELLEQLTERQRTYIQKLSRAKGREIIPVDMALYRELMSLELIVDKGRRLALTKLGQEISLFL